MRKFVYQNEVEFVFYQYDIDETERDRIKTALFIHPFRKGKQLTLKNKFSHIDDLDQALEEDKNGENFTGAIKSLFEIDEDLKLPPELKKLILDNSPVAVFIGAGVSKLLKYPLWNELANNAIQFLLDKGRINHLEFQRLNNEIQDPKQKLSIFEKFCPRDGELGKTFYKKAFKRKDKENIQNPYEFLVSPFFNWVKITSNIEYELLDALYQRETSDFIESQVRDKDSDTRYDFPGKDGFKRNRIISGNFSTDDINIDQLYYLHGELDHIEDTIFTTEDYIENYFSDSNMKSFLQEIFENFNVIFMGYGLAEFPILESVMNQGNKMHYALMPSYFHEANIFRIKERYYKQLNIKTIPYYIDFRGYGRLHDVLESWEKELITEIEGRADSYFENLDLIDEVL